MYQRRHHAQVAHLLEIFERLAMETGLTGEFLFRAWDDYYEGHIMPKGGPIRVVPPPPPKYVNDQAILARIQALRAVGNGRMQTSPKEAQEFLRKAQELWDKHAK